MLGYFFRYRFITKGNIIVVNNVVITIAEYTSTEIIQILKIITATANHIAPLLFMARPIKCNWWDDRSLTNGLATWVQINFPHIAKTIITTKIHQFTKIELTSKNNPILIKKKGMINIFRLSSIFKTTLWCLQR
jgi:hypothetical protein